LSLGKNVSCGGGGRYDNLIESISGKSIPATGISLGLDRIFEVMKEEKMFDKFKKRKVVFVANVDEQTKNKTIEIANNLRENWITSQIDVSGWKLSRQLEYANKIGVDFVLIVGKKELAKKSVKVKDMKSGKETDVKIKNLVDYLKSS